MVLSDAVFTRSSCRDFAPQPLSPAQRQQLEKAVGTCNFRSGLHVQLVCGDPEPFSSLLKSWGRIRGARNYFLLAGPSGDPDLEEKCGFYGEELVLTAQCMGLGTCWVGGTYDKERCAARLAPGEELVCVIAVGCPAHPDKPAADRSRKPLEELAPDARDAPEWFRAGMEAVRRAPSAMNRQGYRFACRPDGSVRVRLSGTGSFALADLGIAKR